MKLRTTSSTLSAVLAGSLLASSSIFLPVRAQDCSGVAAAAGDTFEYAICDVPDIDQRRAASGWVKGLPGDGGMYCVPTASMNWVAYLANNGYWGMEPGEGGWGPGSAIEYGKMTDALVEMGKRMKTDKDNGTGGWDGAVGLQSWLDEYEPGRFVVSQYYLSENTTVSFDDMAKTAIDGSYVIPCVGWYTNPDTALKHIRAGGHAITLVSAQKVKLREGFGRTMGIHDPASPDDGDLMTQSAFDVDLYRLTPTVGTFGWTDDDGVEHTFSATADRVNLYGSAYLDGYYAIRAKLFVTAVGPEIYVYWPYPDKPRPEIFRSPTADPVLDVALHPQFTKHPFLVERSGVVWQFDTVTGEVDAFATVPGAQRIVFGADQTLYVLTASGTIVGLDRNGRPVRRGQAAGGLTLDAIAFDDASDRLVGYSRQRNTLVFFDSSLEVRGTATLRSNPVAQGRGRISMSIAPTTGAIHLTTDGLPGVVRATIRRSGSAVTRFISLPGVSDPAGLTVDERGHIFVSSGGFAAEFDGNGRPVGRSPFAAMHSGSVVQVLRPFSNFDPAMATSPSFRNVLPPRAR